MRGILLANLFLVTICLISTCVADPPIPDAVSYPDHSNLLIVRDANGNERPVATKVDWQQRLAHIRANMQVVMGPLPDASKKVPLAAEFGPEQITDKYVRRKVTFTPEPGDRVTAWLLIPQGIPANKTAPAMLCLHQTNNVGKDEPAGLGGLKYSYYAHELAERGFIAIAPDYPSFGEYKYDFKTQGAHYASGSMKAIWNNIRTIDLLETIPQVDKNNIGVIGHSLGGHNALFTATFDERLKAVVSSCGFTPFHDYYKGDLKGWTSDRYMPRIREVYNNDPNKVPFDFYEILAGLAPRGFYSNSPVHDSNFEVEGVRKAFAKADAIFGLYNANFQLVLRTPDAPHEFPEAQRFEAYEWLKLLLARQ